MKITNRRLVMDAKFLGSLTEKKLPIKVSYALAKNISKIETELNIYSKERSKLIDKYCKKDKDGKNIVDKDNNLSIEDIYLDDWNKDLNELLDIEIEIDIHKFNINDLLNSNCEMTASELMLIDYMIEE